jgi:hypothetical protein
MMPRVTKTAAILILILGASVSAQQPGRGGRGAQAPQTPQSQAPADLTGWWVSVVTEDWRWRMVTPKKGDYASMPITDEGRKAADAWDPAKDEREGNACKAYGAAAIMRTPTRLHITWQDDSALKIETDAGTQTRIFRFGESGDSAISPDRSWQGRSKASWEFLGNVGAARGGGGQGFNGGGGGGGFNAGPGGGGGAANPPGPRYGSLKVVTDRLKPGYLRKNGIPYSENALVTEYFDRQTEKNGDVWITVTTIVEDPKNLTGPYITSSGFKKEADGSKWRATPCSAQ